MFFTLISHLSHFFIAQASESRGGAKGLGVLPLFQRQCVPQYGCNKTKKKFKLEIKQVVTLVTCNLAS